jgi:beta-galactosidase
MGLSMLRAPMPARRPSARPKRASAAVLNRGALQLDGREVPLWSGALHYFRTERGHWRRALESLRELGLCMVESYVPWGLHETVDGGFDFGARNPNLDLPAFIDLAGELGLWVFLRPGPHINAELTRFGLPARVLDDPRCQALGRDGQPVVLPAPPRAFPVPSFASHEFRRQSRHWLETFARQVTPKLYPNGPVVLLQVDNEAAFYFRDHAYDQDYHPDAIEAYRAFVKQRHGSLEQVRARYALESLESWDALQPPQRFDAVDAQGLVRHLDWSWFQQSLVQDALSDQVSVLRRALGRQVPLVHNLPMGDAALPHSIRAVQSTLDAVGLDYYHAGRSVTPIRDRTLRLASASALPFAPELGVGAPPWFGPRRDRDALFIALCACAFGLRGMNLYMAVDRDRWFGAPIAADGGPRSAAEPWRRLLSALRALRFHSLERRTEIALQLPREYAHLARVTHALGSLSPNLFGLAGLPLGATSLAERFGFAEDIQRRWAPVLDAWMARLQNAGLPFALVDSDAPLPAGTRVLIAPCYELADATRVAELQRFVDAGGQLLYGPQRPSLDGVLAPLDAPALGGAAQRLDDPALQAASIDAWLGEAALQRPFLASPAPVFSSVHVDADGEPRVVFLIQPMPGFVEAQVALPRALELRDVLTDQRFAGEHTATVPMVGPGCRMLEVCEPQTDSSPPSGAEP